MSGKSLLHVIEDKTTVLAGIVDRDGHELVADALELEIQLESGDTDLGAAELEVHVAEVIFTTDDVGQQGVARELAVAVILRDETDGDAGDRALEGHTCVEQRENACTDRGHRGGAVGLHDLAGHTQGIRELLLARDDREDGTLGECTVANLAAVLTSETAGLTDAEGREVVMEKETLGRLTTTVSVDHLGLVGGGKCCQCHGLGLTAGEESGTVRARENSRLAGQLTKLQQAATVAALLLVQDADAESLLLEIIKRLRDLELRGGGILLKDLGAHLLAECTDCLATGNLARSIKRGLDAVTGDLIGDLKHSLVDIEKGELTLWLAGLGD